MEDLIKDIQERTGLPADKVLEVVTMVTEYMKQALPEDLVNQVVAYLGTAAETAGTAAEGAKGAAGSAADAASAGAGDVFEKATNIAGSAFSAAKDVMNDVLGTSKDE